MKKSSSTSQLAHQIRRRIVNNSANQPLITATQESTNLYGVGQLHDVSHQVRASITGAGKLQPLLETSEVTDVVVNGAKGVWIDRGNGMERTKVTFQTDAEVRDLAVRLAGQGGKRLDDSVPAVDARLSDGTRLHAILPPLSPHGTVLSLRVPARTPLTLEELTSRKTVGAMTATILRALIAQRAAFLVCGATGSGKTTLLASLLSLIPEDERLIIIEESQELNPDHPHVVHLQNRNANIEGAGEITLTDLVRHSLRMRPDRIVLGECRGPEIREMFTALNTGHDGGCATLHANAAADVPTRLAALGALADLSPEAMAAQASSALDVVVFLRRGARGRWVEEIALLERKNGAELHAVTAWTSPHPGIEEPGPGAEKLAKKLNLNEPSMATQSRAVPRHSRAVP